MNLPTIIIASIVAVVVIAIIAREVKLNKSGKGNCWCGSCSGCAFKDQCHDKSNKDE